MSTSTIISVIMSVIAAVGATSVYVSRRVKKYPMRSKSSARMSPLAATAWAAYKDIQREKDSRKNRRDTC
jgi:hypothetical protein